MPRGGPDGGDGGEGGSVIFVASSQLSTLQDFRFKRVYDAPGGKHGSGGNKAGKDGETIRVRVPVGTLFKDAETGEVLADLTRDGEEWIACKGGRGGKGNAHFTTSTFQAPKFAQPGEEGQRREILLELKLLADAGILGAPNAGKSTLISRLSAARPKIADYPFTTLVPNLGVVSLPDYESFVIADIPGLVEGAHRGKGLGHKFLKHLERTRAFVHLLDGAKLLEAVTDPSRTESALDELATEYAAIRKELGLYNEELLTRPELVVINKGDLFASDPELLDRAREILRKQLKKLRKEVPAKKEPWVISAATGAGVNELLKALQTEIRR